MTVYATLCFLMRDGEVLLIRKRRGFGAGKYNGVGGRIEEGERPEQAAAREVWEEVGVKVLELEYAGRLEFYSTGEEPDWVVYVYRSRRFRGEPRPSLEAEPRWFRLEELPFDEMWIDDRYWLPHVLAGRVVEGRFRFNSDYTELLEWSLDVNEYSQSS